MMSAPMPMSVGAGADHSAMMPPNGAASGQSEGSSRTRRRPRRRSEGRAPRRPTSSLAPLVMAAGLMAARSGAGSAFVHDGSARRPRRQLLGGDFSDSHVRVNPRRRGLATRRPSGTGAWAWGEAFQNAIGSLDRRLEIKDGVERRRRRAAEGDGDDGRIEFVTPLLEDGYPPAVREYEEFKMGLRRRPKPMLLYLPGFDGTVLAPFLQFPSLGEEFDVRAMNVDMEDRSTFEELKDAVVDFLLRECQGGGGEGGLGVVYLMGESFGGILATEVAFELNRPTYDGYVELRGLILVNPATSYLRSSLYELGPPIANAQPLIPALAGVQYVFSLVTSLVPLFLDRGRAMQQLITILSSKGLPSVVNNPQREAYMGRVAFDLPNRLKFMPKDTLEWRLEEWLEWGNGVFEDRLGMLQSTRDSDDDEPADIDNYALLKVSQELRTMIIVGEFDLTLPSLDEANRLSSEVFRNAFVHVVPEAGHASTCGGSLNLIKLIREVFPETRLSVNGLQDNASREELHGLEARYDGALIGLNPLLYWSKDYYQRWLGNN
ncbi:hypothetical protein ACHAWF_014766 [Thalassiosira exigua]